MSKLNGDRARFHKDRKRKLRRRQRIQELIKAGRTQPAAPQTVSINGLAAGDANVRFD
jgi:hypothetical protein